jgi:hypothetical protein
VAYSVGWARNGSTARWITLAAARKTRCRRTALSIGCGASPLQASA